MKCNSIHPIADCWRCTDLLVFLCSIDKPQTHFFVGHNAKSEFLLRERRMTNAGQCDKIVFIDWAHSKWKCKTFCDFCVRLNRVDCKLWNRTMSCIPKNAHLHLWISIIFKVISLRVIQYKKLSNSESIETRFLAHVPRNASNAMESPLADVTSLLPHTCDCNGFCATVFLWSTIVCYPNRTGITVMYACWTCSANASPVFCRNFCANICISFYCRRSAHALSHRNA